MQVIHCTKKLLAELGALGSKMPHESLTGSFGPWHANLLRIERRKCLLFTNDRTLYSFLVPGFTKKDNFHDLFLVNLNDNLAVEGLGQGERFKALEEYCDIAIVPTASRSVLGSMNDLAGQVEFLVHRAGGLEKADILRVNMMLNRVPMGALKYKYAIERVCVLFGRKDAVRKLDDPFTMTFAEKSPGLNDIGDPSRTLGNRTKPGPHVKNTFSKVFQFKIALLDINPSLWRRIVVPETCSFWDLHVAIQDSMGWMDCHLHEFEMNNLKTGKKDHIGIPPEDYFEDDPEVFPGWKKKIAAYFTLDNASATYRYDFGDNWRHEVVLEKIEPRATGVSYPVCIGGERACPPEDCGGTYGYRELLEIIMDPAHERYGEMTTWAGATFDPERFDQKKVRFDDPAKRLKRAME